jgi:FkbM family methyltransferase
MSAIEQDDGWWWPRSDKRARHIIPREARENIPRFLKHVPGRDVIIQAGGNVGVYPLALADHFQVVATFEPDPLNHLCLTRNLQARDALSRVEAAECALGTVSAKGRMLEFEPGNCGAHKVQVGHGDVVVTALDDIAWPKCDAIWLDIEGNELAALRGAEKLIERFSPVIAFEDKGLGVSPCVWLEARGYQQIDRIDNDRVFRRTP